MTILELLTPAEAGANILRHVEARTLEQGAWHSGRVLEIACLLGAIHEDIKKPGECPASVMPLWLAVATVTLFDGLAPDAIYPIAARYGALVASGAAARADEALLARWLCVVIRDACASAEPVVWPQIVAAGDQVIAALRNGLPAEEWAPAWASRVAVAWASASLARSASPRSQRARAAAAVERAAAYLRLFTALLDEIEIAP